MLVGFTDPYNITYFESYSKILRAHEYKDKGNDKDNAKTKTQTKCMKHPAYTIILKS